MTVTPLMTLDEFLEEARRELDAMERLWRAQHARNPQEWPLEMVPGDWDAQRAETDWLEIPDGQPHAIDCDMDEDCTCVAGVVKSTHVMLELELSTELAARVGAEFGDGRGFGQHAVVHALCAALVARERTAADAAHGGAR